MGQGSNSIAWWWRLVSGAGPAPATSIPAGGIVRPRGSKDRVPSEAGPFERCPTAEGVGFEPTRSLHP